MDMADIIGIVVLMGLVWIAAFYQLSSLKWTVLIGVGLVLLSIAGYFSPLIFIFLWLVFLAAAAFANLKEIRQQYILKPALAKLKSQLPTISDTERAAIEAGDTWWEKELFCGRPDWKKLFNIPKPTLSVEEESFINNQVEHLCSMLDDWDISFKEHDLPPNVWEYLKKEKFFGMVIPKQYGGMGFSALAHSTVVTKIATRNVSAAVTTMVPNSLGPGELLLHYGTDEQKNYYLPRLAAGLEIPCFALTGPDAGSDAGAIPDSGIVCRGIHEGKEVLGIRLSWDKRYITLAPIATVLGIAFKLYDPDKLIGDKANIGITLCLLPTSHPGVEVGHRHLPMELGFMNGPTRGKDVFIPLEWIIGGQKMAGQGWRMLMECLSIGRSISLPALATASSKFVYRYTGAYSRIRKQFNTSIGNFEGVDEALGYISGYTYMIEAMRIMTAGAVDLKINPAIVSAIAKYHMTEMGRSATSHAMDIHGGHGIQNGPRNSLANIYKGTPISITVEGANILTRNLIIFGQGAIRCHPYILKEVEIISAKDTNIEELDDVLMKHIGFFASNMLRSFAYGLSGGIFIFSGSKNKRIRRYKRQLVRMSTALALLADTSLILLGGSLKRRERISARLGDLLSQLYAASAVLKYYHDNHKPTTDLDNVYWALEHCLYKMQIACNEIFANFPNRLVGHLLHWIVFPFGAAYKAPNDKLNSAIVAPMLTPSEFRDRLTKYVFLSQDPNDPLHRMDLALTKIEGVEALQKKLQKAVQTKDISPWLNFDERIQAALQKGLISESDAQALTEYEALRTEIIKVDEFSFDLKEMLA